MKSNTMNLLSPKFDPTKDLTDEKMGRNLNFLFPKFDLERLFFVRRSKFYVAVFLIVFVMSAILPSLSVFATPAEEEILECSPDQQITFVGQNVSFSVTALVGSQDRFYVWSAPGGYPDLQSGQNLN
ncbi:MAG: hypothetical protein HY506_02165, partial [Candidatus Yanofskybacteria bacterium]|nr:hypothetical protein [Candidatus Yanofskybacteria bacterium]